ncbi:hypothetical protein [Botrimarina sp.]|uniref:hypothetical protein n=1 Tax=Botrimarina sp. TaxID=2795802 RepID=UPI0032EB1F83
MSKQKTLCDWSKKDLRERFEELRELVSQPQYVCLKCGRAASQKGALCKAQSLEKPPK